MRRRPSHHRFGTLVTLALTLGACGTGPAPQSPDRPVSTALAAPEITRLGRLFEPYAKDHPGKSGFAVVESGRDAYRSRYAFARLAEKTIDVQYYIWTPDATGTIFLAALLEAAERGVRVRMLLDDMYLAGKDDILARVAAHPNVEIRLFNPFAGRSFRLADYIFDFSRITHRMHNKAFIVDNAVAVVGGRNIGDHYFGVDAQSNYRDLDLFAAGPIVRDVSATFDAFWNSAWSAPVDRFSKETLSPAEWRARAGELRRRVDSYKDYPFDKDPDPAALQALVEAVPARLIWGEATVVADRPNKPKTSHPGLLEAAREALAGDLHEELLVESAYFIPGEEGVAHFCGLVARGVRVRVLTNSFASNDVITAFSGYYKYRKPLLRCGVELYELRADAGFVEQEWTWLKSRSLANLHTKAAVIDRRHVFVGSFNMDPRSRDLNTELAILVDSPALADEVSGFISAGMAPDNAYSLHLDDDGEIVWLIDEGGRRVRYTDDPHAGFWRSLLASFLALLPIEGQL